MHVLAGFTRAGRRVQAWCSCGERATPRVNEERALAALEQDHGTSTPTCERCGDQAWSPPPRRHAHLHVLVNGWRVPDLLDVVTATTESDEAWLAWREAEQMLVCADTQACRARTAADGRAAEAEETRPVPPTTLRLIRGGRS